MQKKIITAIIIFIAVSGIILGVLMYLGKKDLILNNNPATQNKIENKKIKETESLQSNTITTKPSGTTVDIIDQTDSQLQTEENIFSSEDNETKSSVISQDDLNNLGQLYDENEF